MLRLTALILNTLLALVSLALVVQRGVVAGELLLVCLMCFTPVFSVAALMEADRQSGASPWAGSWRRGHLGHPR
jgi:multisubunit Na+/H+ antiporter MnhG subunit